MAALCRLRSDTVIIFGDRMAFSVIQVSKRRLGVKVILRLRLPFPRSGRFAHSKVTAKREALLYKVALLGAAGAESALDAVDVRRSRVSAEVAALRCVYVRHHRRV